MVGPRYTIAQTRARVAALRLAANHLVETGPHATEEQHQYDDVVRKLLNEADRLYNYATELRRRDSRRTSITNVTRPANPPTPTDPPQPQNEPPTRD